MKRNMYLLIALLSICLFGCTNKSSNPTQEEVTLGPIPERSIEAVADNSVYFEMLPVDEKTYEVLKAEYAKVGFEAAFQKGDENTYNEYLEKYVQLINNEISYRDENGQECYLKDIDSAKDINGEFIIENNKYYVFDIDGDDRQELYVRTLSNRIYVFKYKEKEDKMCVWYEEENTSYYYFLGTQAKGWSNGGAAYVFYKLNEFAGEDMAVKFEQINDMNPKTKEGETVYMVKLPEYADKSKNLEMTRELQEQSYCIAGEYYFRVTEEQFDELTAAFFETDSKVKERLAEVEIIQYKKRSMNNEVYESFLRSEIPVMKTDNKYYWIKDLLENAEGKYLYCDIDGDDIDELHVKSDKVYFIIKKQKDGLQVLYEGSCYEEPINQNGLRGVLYFRKGGAPTHDSYQYYSMDSEGVNQNILEFEWYDENENELMDSEDIYLFNNENMEEEEWKEKTRLYRKNVGITQEWYKWEIEF